MTTKRLLADIPSLTPSNYDDFMRCPRLFYNSALLGIPASDQSQSPDQGLQTHAMLEMIHKSGACDDEANVADVLNAHGAATPIVREMVSRHARRCPSRASERDFHEKGLARFHKLPVPMFMATARIDAIWIHDGLLDARDYKTGGRYADRVADIHAAHVQAFVLAPAAQRLGLRLQLRYEYLQPEIDDDPEPWELDDDDLEAIEEELRLAIAHMWEETDWRGVADATLCGNCRYRSICRDSVTRGEASWPALSDDAAERFDR